MTTRSLLRILLCLGIIAAIWYRGGWFAMRIGLTILLGLFVFMEIGQMRRRGRWPADEVPKRPLGL